MNIIMNYYYYYCYLEIFHIFFNKKGLALEVEIILFINIVFFLNY